MTSPLHLQSTPPVLRRAEAQGWCSETLTLFWLWLGRMPLRQAGTKTACSSPSVLTSGKTAIGDNTMSIAWPSHDMRATVAQHITNPPRPVHNDTALRSLPHHTMKLATWNINSLAVRQRHRQGTAQEQTSQRPRARGADAECHLSGGGPVA